MLRVCFFDLAADNGHLVGNVLAFLSTSRFTVGASRETVGLTSQIQMLQFTFDLVPGVVIDQVVLGLNNGGVGRRKFFVFLPTVSVFAAQQANSGDGLVHVWQTVDFGVFQVFADFYGSIFFGDFQHGAVVEVPDIGGKSGADVAGIFQFPN